ncbi:retrovirus-related pol polyprotein from transposon TNT 1-94 [Tanacetum coccineum]
MLIYAKAPLFLWAEAVTTACYTQNRSIIRRRHRKTPYELLHDRKPDLSYLHVFGALFYPNNDSEDLGKLQAKADIGIFIGYTPEKKAYFPVVAAPRAVDLADSPVSTYSVPSKNTRAVILLLSVQSAEANPKSFQMLSWEQQLRRVGGREKIERVRASGYGDRVDPEVGSIFGVGRKTRRKIIPAP